MDVFIVYGNVRTYSCQFKELLMSYNTLHNIIIMYMHTHNVREILNWYYPTRPLIHVTTTTPVHIDPICRGRTLIKTTMYSVIKDQNGI